MDKKYFLPFVQSTSDVFSMMLSTKTTALTPRMIIGRDQAGAYEVYGLIGINGDIKGAFRIKLPRSTAINLVNRMVGEEVDPNSPDFADAIGEISNMVAGGAKSKMGLHNTSITTPTVAVGRGLTVAQMQNAITLEFPHDSDAGVFSIEVTMEAA